MDKAHFLFDMKLFSCPDENETAHENVGVTAPENVSQSIWALPVWFGGGGFNLSQIPGCFGALI